ncbi:peptidase inhibitor family I36 protein [Actinoplanes sp. CA-252034]|uniref:peptidase inhibitor family I36 protein n=1 Tax=Actinoplanes sp. CA-252034 TaxID=3239906 RepID=UPI003D97D405
MHLRTLIASAATVTALATGLVAGPAQAAEDIAGCPDGGLCAYTEQWFNGTRGVVYANNTNLLQYYAFNNAQSVFNDGQDCNVRIYSGRSYTGSGVTIPRQHYFQAFAPSSPYYNNIASNKWCV